MVTMDSSVTVLRGIGDKTAQLYSKMGIDTVGDLLHNYPVGYDDLSAPQKISELTEENKALVFARVAEQPRWVVRRGRFSMFAFDVEDGSGMLRVNVFNLSFLFRKYKKGDVYYFYGRPKLYKDQFQMDNPVVFAGNEKRKLLPKYRVTAGISQRAMTKAIDAALTAVNIEERYTNEFLMSCGLLDEQAELELIHHPNTPEERDRAGRSMMLKRMLVYERVMELMDTRTDHAEPMDISEKDMLDYTALLGFDCTGDQQRAMYDILNDLTGEKPMNRILQGDVGSGKTAVAFCAAFLAERGGGAAAMMAPTELLARQHYENAVKIFSKRAALLTGSTPVRERARILEGIQEGSITFLIGTHALLYSELHFRNLRLIITDEQHRFGVGQRAALAGGSKGLHTLIMSATPIPRTLMLSLYSRTDVSIIKEMPPGRQVTETFIIGNDSRVKMYRWLAQQVGAGAQAYVVCPLIEDSEGLDVRSVESVLEELSSVFAPEELCGLNGRMSASEKEEIMERFCGGEIKVLVSTTVIEVGVDVPEATVMVVESADRFGLAQLHQLRGRVGRGAKKSYCYLVSDGSGLERLKVLKETNDGFKIAEKDLELRGGGELLGERQHGDDGMMMWQLIRNADMLKECRRTIDAMAERFPRDFAVLCAMAEREASDRRDRVVLN